MDRRNFLKLSGRVSAQSSIAGALLTAFWTKNAFGEPVPLSTLQTALQATEGKVLLSGDPQFVQCQTAFNLRTMQIPQVRVLCSTPQAVAIAIHWARENTVPLATRAGGHSLEGFSQSQGLVIDLRPSNQIQISADHSAFVTDAGVQLSNVYANLAQFNKTIPGSSCPTSLCACEPKHLSRK